MPHTQSISPAMCECVSAEVEVRAFGLLRFRILTTTLRHTLSQSRFRISLVVLLTGLFWCGMFWLFADAFGFLKATITDPDMHFRTMIALFGTFFAALMLLLVFSSGIILYGLLFRSREVAFLLTLPVSIERVFLHKFQEAILLSSWGFMLLGSPMLLAYGVAEDAPWYFYLMLPPYILSFIYIPVGIGAIFCLLIVRHFPGGRTVALAGGISVLLALTIWFVGSLLNGDEYSLLTPEWFRDILTRLRFSEKAFLPSWWLSSGLLAASCRERWQDSILFLALLISNALFLRQLAGYTARRTYRESYSGLVGYHTPRHRHPYGGRFDRALATIIGLFHTPSQLFIIKDLRLFRRDPLQWSQFLIFIALLGLYFVNIRRFSYDTYYIGWVNMVSFLNLAVVGLLLSTFMTRFIFPMISLEGRRFWLLGLAAIDRDTILWSKFIFAVLGAIGPCTLLVFLSDTILGVSSLVCTSHQLTCLVLCFGLSGIAVGLGARLPSPHEQSPSRIAAGFGGTLNLVLSTIFILLVVLLTALPTHFFLAAQSETFANGTERQADLQRWVSLWLAAGSIASVLIGIIATVVPMRLGFLAFRKMEF